MRRLALLFAAVGTALTVFAAGCGKSPSSPSSTSDNPPATPTYLGTVSQSDGRSGTLMARASASLAAVRPGKPDLLRGLLSLLEAPLWAQGSSALGTLVLNDGTVIELSGSFGGGTFSLSGSGYTLTATVNGESISGSGTGPGGVSVNVSSLAVAAVVPPNPEGTYNSSFRIEAASFSTNKDAATGRTIFSCSYTTVITGTLSILIRSDSPGNYFGHLKTDATETPGPPGTCTSFPPPAVPAGPSGTDYQGSARTLHFGRTERDTPSGGAVRVRAETFIGAFSGSTIVGRWSRTFNYTLPINNGAQMHTEGFAMTGVDVVLVK